MVVKAWFGSWVWVGVLSLGALGAGMAAAILVGFVVDLPVDERQPGELFSPALEGGLIAATLGIVSFLAFVAGLRALHRAMPIHALAAALGACFPAFVMHYFVGLLFAATSVGCATTWQCGGRPAWFGPALTALWLVWALFVLALPLAAWRLSTEAPQAAAASPSASR